MNEMQKMLFADGTVMTLMGIICELNFHMEVVDTHHQVDLAIAAIVVELPDISSIVSWSLPFFASWQDFKAHMRCAGYICFSDVYRDRGGEAHEISLCIISISYLYMFLCHYFVCLLKLSWVRKQLSV
ncbi:hypothetical protein Dimus_033210 [Dionaea muscipula]